MSVLVERDATLRDLNLTLKEIKLRLMFYMLNNHQMQFPLPTPHFYTDY